LPILLVGWLASPAVAEGQPAAVQADVQPPSPLGKLADLLDTDFHLGPWRFRGYVQLDAARYGQAPPGPPETDFRRGPLDPDEADRARDLTDGVLLRRARFGGEGSIGEHLAYRVMLELAPNGQRGQARIAEVWVSYSRIAPYVVTLGAFPQPSNLADATSFDSTLFLERPAAADLARGLGAGEGRIGVTLKRADPRWFAALSLTGPPIDHPEEFAPRAAIVARVSRSLAKGPDRSLHLGASATYVLVPSRKRPSDLPSGFPVRFQSEPEARVADTPLIDTGEMQASHASVVGLELSGQRRNLILQGEVFRFQVEHAGPPPAPHFYGFYLEGSWILTGERRRFDPSRAAFWFPKPDQAVGQGWGAWELVVRYSRMNLNSRAGEAGQAPPPGGVRGGDQKILAAGLNWYPRRRVRLMLDYMRVSVDRLNPAGPDDPAPFGPAPATPPIGVQIGQKLNILALRVRYSF
jgi:phosphate-selective porin OprO/OprP